MLNNRHSIKRKEGRERGREGSQSSRVKIWVCCHDSDCENSVSTEQTDVSISYTTKFYRLFIGWLEDDMSKLSVLYSENKKAVNSSSSISIFSIIYSLPSRAYFNVITHASSVYFELAAANQKNYTLLKKSCQVTLENFFFFIKKVCIFLDNLSKKW